MIMSAGYNEFWYGSVAPVSILTEHLKSIVIFKFCF
jgi:hypothetical protein